MNFKIKNTFFYHPAFLLIVISAVLLNNLYHSSVLYHLISPGSGLAFFDWIIAIAVNIIIDLAVVAFVVYGKHIEAGIFAGCIFLINALFWEGIGLVDDQEVRKHIAQFIYSVMFSYSIYRFSHLIFSMSEEESLMDILNRNIIEITKQKDELEAALKSFITKEKDYLLQIEKLKAELNSFTRFQCPECSKAYSTQSALNAHKCKV